MYYKYNLQLQTWTAQVWFNQVWVNIVLFFLNSTPGLILQKENYLT